MTRVPGHVIHVHPPGEAGVVVDLLQHVGRELEPRVAGAVRVGDVVLLLQHRTCHDCHNTCHVSRTVCPMHVCLFSSTMPSMLRQPLQPPVWPTYLCVGVDVCIVDRLL